MTDDRGGEMGFTFTKFEPEVEPKTDWTLVQVTVLALILGSYLGFLAAVWYLA